MLITTLASTIAAMLFLVAMLFVTISDLRSRRIPNWVVLTLVAVYAPLAWTAGYQPLDMALNLGVALLVFCGGLFLFAKGWIGGGDVKLAAATVLWLGMSLAVPYLLLTAVFGAAFTLAALIGLRFMSKAKDTTSKLRQDGLPYAPGMACAGLLLFQISPWANALPA